MSNLFLTLVLAFVCIVVAIACLAIGWLVTGKNKMGKVGCGRNPQVAPQGKEGECSRNSSCSLCGEQDKKNGE